MKVFHGSLEIVKNPLILPRKNGHTADFGLGFYTTTSKEQAERWVKIRKGENQSSAGYVNVYEIPDSLLQNSELKILRFDEANESWLDFVIKNRMDTSFTHEYDLVFGKVANDRVYTTINLYEDGFLNKDETLKRLKTFVLVDQLLFHTQKSLAFLTFTGAEKL